MDEPYPEAVATYFRQIADSEAMMLSAELVPLTDLTLRRAIRMSAIRVAHGAALSLYHTHVAAETRATNPT